MSPITRDITISRNGQILRCGDRAIPCDQIASADVATDSGTSREAVLIIHMQSGDTVCCPLSSYHNAETIRRRLACRAKQTSPVAPLAADYGYAESYWH